MSEFDDDPIDLGKNSKRIVYDESPANSVLDVDSLDVDSFENYSEFDGKFRSFDDHGSVREDIHADVHRDVKKYLFESENASFDSTSVSSVKHTPIEQIERKTIKCSGEILPLSRYPKTRVKPLVEADIFELLSMKLALSVPFRDYETSTVIKRCCGYINYGHTFDYLNEPVMYDNIFRHQNTLYGEYMSHFLNSADGKELSKCRYTVNELMSLIECKLDKLSKVRFEGKNIFTREDFIVLLYTTDKESLIVSGDKMDVRDNLDKDRILRNAIFDEDMDVSGDLNIEIGYSEYSTRVSSIITMYKLWYKDTEFQKGSYTSVCIELDKLISNLCYTDIWLSLKYRRDVNASIQLGESIALFWYKSYIDRINQPIKFVFNKHDESVITVKNLH